MRSASSHCPVVARPGTTVASLPSLRKNQPLIRYCALFEGARRCVSNSKRGASLRRIGGIEAGSKQRPGAAPVRRDRQCFPRRSLSKNNLSERRWPHHERLLWFVVVNCAHFTKPPIDLRGVSRLLPLLRTAALGRRPLAWSRMAMDE